MRLIVDSRDAFDQKERKVDHLQELLACQAIESENDQEKMRTLEVQMTAIESTVEELENHLMNVKENQEDLRGKLELTESEKSRLSEVAADLQDRNCELEKNLADETQKNLVLEDQVQFLESVLRQKESQLVSASEILNAERVKTEITAEELHVMRNWVSELGGENANFKEELEAKAAEVTSLNKELDNEKKRTQVLAGEAQVMKNWVAELGGQNANFKEELEAKEEEVHALKKELDIEKKQTQVLAGEAQVMKNWVAELGGQNANFKEELEAKEEEVHALKKELVNEKKQTQVLAGEAQVMKNWVAEQGGQNAKLQDEVKKNHLKINSLLKSLSKEKQRSRHLQDALHHGKEMENLLKEEKLRGSEMAASLRTVKIELENRDLQIENFLNMERKLICEKEELADKLGVALNHGKKLDSLLEEANEKARKFSNDFEEEVQKRETQMRDFLSKEEQLRAEKLELVDRLENAANLLIKEERENVHSQQMLQEKEKEVETLRKDEEDHHKQRKEMEIQLEEDEKELQHLRTECEQLKENWRIQEEKMIREQEHLRERQRRQEEALREQDKYMLMTLLHGTAQRNFHLQHIALQHGIETLDNANDKKQDEGQEEDLWMRKDKQHKKYCDAQRDRTNYRKQWDVLTQTLKDVTNGDSDKNCEISNKKPDDKTCHHRSKEEICMIEPYRAKTCEEKED
ncbi:early endosome antigen 1-like [Macrobrachium nipponense]|uniref:early endosome antigen 1-like n=1 Tax=Macrobrachium nipponense TaxID=159736 RepID=UPI0030C8C3BD